MNRTADCSNGCPHALTRAYAHTQNADVDLQRDSKPTGQSSTASIGQNSFAFLWTCPGLACCRHCQRPVSANLQGGETVPRAGEGQIVLEDTPKPGIDWMLNRSTSTREPLKVLERRSQLINCTFIYGTIFGRSLLPTGLRALPSEYLRHLEQCLVCRKCLMNE